MRMPDFTPCWPGLVSSLHLESSELAFGSAVTSHFLLLLFPREIVRLRLRFPGNQSDESRFSLSSGLLIGRKSVFTFVRGSNSTPLRRPAAVVRHGRHVGDAADLEAERIERA